MVKCHLKLQLIFSGFNMKRQLILAFFVVFPFFLCAKTTVSDTVSQNVSYNMGKGFEFKDNSGNFLMQMQWRLQFRTAYPTKSDFIKVGAPEETVMLGINRARMKVGGHAFTPNLKYYLEYELFQAKLLDYRIMVGKSPALNLKFGQWKVQYHRERIISSGKQQTLERSILTPAFTVDRQQGVSLFGNLAGEGAVNFNYWLSTFMGNGRGASSTLDPHLMYMARFQWNPNGGPLAFSGSDLEFHERFKMLFALAALTNTSEFTRFSTSGGGQLEGFEPGLPEQYQINQFLQESAGKYKGLSWQQELHFKNIDDRVNNKLTKMWGNLVQVGYFPGHAIEKVPEKLELFFRHAFYYPDYGVNKNIKKELTFGGNWFFYGHRLKLTGDISYLDSNFQNTEIYFGWRYRLQVDISL